MSQSIPTTPAMCEIPLSVDEPGDTLPDAHKINNSKTNSLKRFFKLTNKRNSGGEDLATASGTKEVMGEGTNDDDCDAIKKCEASGGGGSGSGIDGQGEVREKPKKDYSKRFHLRLGGMNRIVDQADTGSFMSSSTSRQTLKNSISTYWNTMFRRASKKTATTQHKATAEDDEADAEEEALETELRDDEVHTLPISEDSLEEVAPKSQE